MTVSDKRLLVLCDEAVDAHALLRHVFEASSSTGEIVRHKIRTRYFEVDVDCWVETYAAGDETTVVDAYLADDAREALAVVGAILVVYQTRSCLTLSRIAAHAPSDIHAMAYGPRDVDWKDTPFEWIDGIEELRTSIQLIPWMQHFSEKEMAIDLDESIAALPGAGCDE
ncbi:hypothetical protein PYCC9005_001056 [Savitreella phatthalungensis]